MRELFQNIQQVKALGVTPGRSLTVLLTFLSITFTSSVLATLHKNHFADSGCYLSGQIGSDSADLGFLDGFLGGMQIENNNGIAGRIAIGSQIFRYFGLELGGAKYPAATRDYNTGRGLFHYGNFTDDSKISDIYSADLVALFRLPLFNYIFINAGGGVAVTHFSFDEINVENEYNKVLSWAAGSSYFFSPEAVLRFGVKFNRNLGVFASASYIFATNGDDPSKRDYQPGLGLASLGLNFHF